MSGERVRALLYVVLLAGAGLRLAWVARPLDARIGGAPWREADYVQIARNFSRDGGSFLYPRVDWRGTTPGFVEMEWPILPWIAGRLPVEPETRAPVMRMMSAALSIGSLLLFAGLARRLLEPTAALFAVAVAATNPLLVYLGSAMQPDGLMLFLSLVAVVLLVRWEAAPRPALLAGAGLFLGAAILAKAPAACLGLLFAYVVWRRLGAASLKTPVVWAAAVLALLPPAAWYAWSHRFWVLYGMSLGLSNESSLIGTDMLAPPTFIIGLLKWETLGVLTPAGWLLLAAALAAARPRSGLVLAWLLSTWIFDVAAARTTSANWAFYYHGLSCEPAALAMGAGLLALARGLPAAAGPRLPERIAGKVAALVAVLVLAGQAVALAALVDRRDHDPDLHAMYDCAQEFAPLIPAGATIVARGGPLVEEHGRPVAHNESMLFAWLDRIGFSYADEELSIATLESIAHRGGRFWIAGRGRMHGGLEEAVRRRFRLLGHCRRGYDLYDLEAVGTEEGAP
jgi:4-amino-4-deoxy-L-arabinose transferase-like glycosyltransferase